MPYTTMKFRGELFYKSAIIVLSVFMHIGAQAQCCNMCIALFEL